ncbi:MAG: hypothetical protein E6K70_26695 [Planctomycetota bacterium]|nr:MAG: hypothetical protein E6K70_26695 [Planctomycetota bacterium]
MEANRFLRLLQQVLQAFLLLEQSFLPLPRRFKLFLNGLPLLLVDVGGVDLRFELADRVAADAVFPEDLCQTGVDHLGQAPQLASNGLCLLDQGGQDAILRALTVHEVMAEDLRHGLQLAVDTAIPLLHAAGVPGNIEMEQVPAVALEVQKGVTDDGPEAR